MAHLNALLTEEVARTETIDRYTQYKPPQIEKRYARDDQSWDERTEFLNRVLKKHGFGPVGSVLKKI